MRKKSKRKSTMWRNIVIAAIAVLTVLLVAGVWYVKRDVTHPKPHVVAISQDEYPIRGVDVSNHNGKIDFKKVADDGIAFVYVKASEGVNYKDPSFATNIRNARKAGLKVGAYHFFRKNKDGIEQARNFTKVIKGIELDMPCVIDVEDWGNSRFTGNGTTIKNLKDMVADLERTGKRLMIYTNKDGYRKYLKLYFPETQLWLCSFVHPNELGAYDWRIHQYSHWGVIDGIDGEVDLDVFNGDCETWERWLASAK